MLKLPDVYDLVVFSLHGLVESGGDEIPSWVPWSHFERNHLLLDCLNRKHPERPELKRLHLKQLPVYQPLHKYQILRLPDHQLIGPLIQPNFTITLIQIIQLFDQRKLVIFQKLIEVFKVAQIYSLFCTLVKFIWGCVIILKMILGGVRKFCLVWGIFDWREIERRFL